MIKDLFRKNLKNFKPYEAENNNFSIRMDANESFLSFPEELKSQLISSVCNTLFNRYPDPAAKEVRSLYAAYAGTSFENVMAGNGSDELIQIIVNSLISTGDKVMLLNPDFSMYSLYTKLAGGIPVEFKLSSSFELNEDALIKRIKDEEVKLVFISNPNNPTGKVIPDEKLLKIVEKSNAIIVIDEAYYEFYGKSLICKVNSYENLVILRTCSKAMGLAALRLGFLISNELLLEEFKKTKPPFNINALTQAVASVLLRRPEFIKNNTELILRERDYLIDRLKNIEDITVYPTEANFLLIEGDCIEELKKKSKNSGISVRSFSSLRLKNCLRITAGTREENTRFLNSCFEGD
jgi:histidinol-phosphate aminotransferase